VVWIWPIHWFIITPTGAQSPDNRPTGTPNPENRPKGSNGNDGQKPNRMNGKDNQSQHGKTKPLFLKQKTTKTH
jgi:hypothetical protein